MKDYQPLEKEIQKTILDWLELNKIFAWTNKTQGTYDPVKKIFRKSKNQMNGVPDILGILPDGRFLAIEVKRKPNKPSAEQIEFIGKAQSLGALCFVSYGLDDIFHQNMKKYIPRP